MKNTKYIFFDIDGTLWDRHQVIPDSTKTALDMLRANGHKIFINTGRSKSNILDDNLCSLPFSGIVAACGNHIELDGEVVYECLLPDDVVKRCIRLVKDNHIPAVFEGPNYHYLDLEDCTEYNRAYIQFLWDRLSARGAAKKIADMQPPYEVNKFSADIPDDCDWKSLEKEFTKDLDIIDHNGKVFELIPKGTTKATGIAHLMDLYHIDLDDIYAVGDGMNDMAMIEFVKHGIAMGNGHPVLKQAAEYVTDDLEKDGIYKAMKHYHLI